MQPDSENLTELRPRVLVVDDDRIIRVTLQDRFRMEGFEVEAVADLAAARDALARARVDLVVTDIRLPDGDGRDLFREICRAHPGVPVVVMTAYISIPDAVALTKAGAVDYLTKPFDLDDLVAKSHRAIERARDLGRAPLVSPDGSAALPGSGILGRSAAMRHVEEIAARVRDVTCSILITGESGVGKEVVARFIHANSTRAAGPFVAVDFAALTEGHRHAELFGEETGAAGERRPGRFEQAQGGTIFLDEIGEVSEEIQLKLLRVLQDHAVEPVGADRPVPLDVRVIAATQVDLEAEVREGRFRADLFWRLNVLPIQIPPMRERRDDILFLARRFAAEHARRMNRPVEGLSAASEELLSGMDYPGNVRELRNMIERAVALAQGPRIQEHDLFPATETAAGGGGPVPGAPVRLKDSVEETERRAILRALERSGNVLTVAAENLGISRKTLWEKMRRYGIARP